MIAEQAIRYTVQLDGSRNIMQFSASALLWCGPLRCPRQAVSLAASAPWKCNNSQLTPACLHLQLSACGEHSHYVPLLSAGAWPMQVAHPRLPAPACAVPWLLKTRRMLAAGGWLLTASLACGDFDPAKAADACRTCPAVPWMLRVRQLCSAGWTQP